MPPGQKKLSTTVLKRNRIKANSISGDSRRRDVIQNKEEPIGLRVPRPVLPRSEGLVNGIVDYDFAIEVGDDEFRLKNKGGPTRTMALLLYTNTI